MLLFRNKKSESCNKKIGGSQEQANVSAIGIDDAGEKPEGSNCVEHQTLYHNLSETELRDISRHQIDAFEHWGRRLIDETFKKHFGEKYLDVEIANGLPLVKQEIIKRIRGRVAENPKRFPRDIDAIVIEDLEYFFCREDLYAKYFKVVFEPFYSGKDELRSVLKRICAIRNKLSHGNTISIHEAEQSVCYAKDLIEAMKSYYQKEGREKEYNVPLFLEIHDWLGGAFIRKEFNDIWEVSYGRNLCDIPNVGVPMQIRSGDVCKIEVFVDSSYDVESYTVDWCLYWDYKDDCKIKGKGTVMEFSLTDKMVSSILQLRILLTTNKTWHRVRFCDDIIHITFPKVLPPIEGAY